MKIGIVVNVMKTQPAGQTTYRLATECAKTGHETWILSTGNFSFDPDDKIRARARPVPANARRSTANSGEAPQSGDDGVQWITIDDLDVLLLRSDPSVQKAWAQGTGIHFGRLAARRGVIVLNHPNGLAKARNKLYLQTYPEEVRPRTLITRDAAKIKRFAEDETAVILKPLQGSGGRNVFVVRPENAANVDQMIQTVSRDGYVIAQEYLPAAADGDTRLFLMNGVPLRYRGKYAAFRRVRSGDDIRSNIHAGGKLRRAEVTDDMLRLADVLRPRLIEDGMFLVGLDVVGDKLMEINVFSPGGLGSAQEFEKVNFARAVVDALERKVQYMRCYGRRLSSVEIATL